MFEKSFDLSQPICFGGNDSETSSESIELHSKADESVEKHSEVNENTEGHLKDHSAFQDCSEVNAESIETLSDVNTELGENTNAGDKIIEFMHI